MAFHNYLGEVGETYAANVLKENGYSVLDKNVRVGNSKSLEIDLLAMDNGILVFVEVKTRQDLPDALEVDEIVSREKKNRLLRAVELYVMSSTLRYDDIRIDYLFVANNRNLGRFEYVLIKDALRP